MIENTQRKRMFEQLEKEIEIEIAKARFLQWALDHINFKKEGENGRIQES